MTCMLGIRQRSTPTADGSWEANADTLQTLIQCGVWGCVFSTVCTRSHCAYKVCFQQLFYKQSNKKQKKTPHLPKPLLMHGCLKAQLNSSPHNLTQMSGEMRTGRSCSPKLQSTKYCAGIVCSWWGEPDSTQWPSTKIRSASHITAIPHCNLPSFFFFTCLIAVCPPPLHPFTFYHNTQCHNSSPFPSLLLWKWISNKILDRSLF